MVKRIKRHCKLWNRWRKHNDNSKIYQIMVLFGFAHSPSFEVMKVNSRLANEILDAFAVISDVIKNTNARFTEMTNALQTIFKEGGIEE